MQTLPKTIRASVDRDAIERVTRFFNATVTETLNELFQNARRAGARRVDVRIEGKRVTVTDDGAGMADPAALLAFGRSDWSLETRRREDPAGMGVYSLARHENVTIRSRPAKQAGEEAPAGWRVRLGPEHFLGKDAASVEPMGPGPAGTEVSFDSPKACGGAVRTAGKHFPLPVTLHENGESEYVERVEFLGDAMRTVDWRGVRIGICRGTTAWNEPEINFHGIAIEQVRLPHVSAIDSEWHTKVEVVDCPELELVLPARKEVVETPFVEELRTACRAAIYRTMAEQEELVEVPARVRDDAARIGIRLPDALARLEPWRAEAADEYEWENDPQERRDVCPGAIVIDTDMKVCDQRALQRAVQRAGMSRRLYHADRRMAGYEWYDRLRKATRTTTAFTLAGSGLSLDELREREKPPESCRPDMIMITLHTTDESGEHRGIDLPADVAFGSEKHTSGDGERPSLLVTADSAISANALAEMATKAYFCASDEADADSTTTQREEYEQIAYEAALALLGCEDDAIRAGVVAGAYQSVVPRVPKDRTLTIRIDHEAEERVTVELSAAPPGEGADAAAPA